MDLIIAVLGILTAAVGVGAAVGSWRAARQANQASETMSTIEKHRWHTGLTPQFDITCRAQGDVAEMRLEFTGPPGLDRLDAVTLAVRDDIPGRAPSTAGGPTPEEIARQVWGPYRFKPRVDGADATGREVGPIDLLLGDEHTFNLERTSPPSWSAQSAEQWRQGYDDRRLRLTITCRHDDHEPWTIRCKIDVQHPPQARFM